MAIDSKRNVMWLYGGANVRCPDPSGPNANPRQDMYYLQLNADPTLATWHQVSPAHYPAANVSAALVYDGDDDVLFAYGYDGSASTHNNWVYCPTAGTATPGVLTSQQSAAGCALPDDWTGVSVVGGIHPPSANFPGMAYDPLTKKVLLYGGNDTGLTVGFNQTWAYDVRTHTWKQKALSTTPPPAYNGSYVAQPAMAYDSKRGKLFFHQTTNTGAPADWQYDPVADTWTKLTTAAPGTSVDQMLAYDSANDVFVGFNRNPANGAAQIWQGRIGSSSAGKTCDLNGDGLTTSADVQLAIQQTLNPALCGTADLNGDGVCDVVDVQRVINASLGQACVIGK
jgi:hypothetical protein